MFWKNESKCCRRWYWSWCFFLIHLIECLLLVLYNSNLIHDLSLKKPCSYIHSLLETKKLFCSFQKVKKLNGFHKFFNFRIRITKQLEVEPEEAELEPVSTSQAESEPKPPVRRKSKRSRKEQPGSLSEQMEDKVMTLLLRCVLVLQCNAILIFLTF